MIFNSFTQKAVFAGLALAITGSISAQEITIILNNAPEAAAQAPGMFANASNAVLSSVSNLSGTCADAVRNAASTVAHIPAQCAGVAYQETLAKHPGKCVLLTGALFAAYLAREQYKQWHNSRATTRRTIADKVQKTYDDYKACGNSVWGNVHNQQQLSVVQSLAQRKIEILSDARRVYNWGMLQDTKLTYLIEEFFAVLAQETSGNALPAVAAPVAQPYWFQFWKHGQPEKRHLDDILVDIKNCLCGGC